MKNFVAWLFSILGLIFYGCTSPYKGPVSDHFDGKKFLNKKNTVTKSLWQVLKWKITETPTKWPEYIPVNPKKINRPKAKKGELRTTFINHASFLVQMGEVNILTDPIYSQRSSPVSFAGPKRVREPGVRFEDLPKIDVVVISHNHYDHFDLATLRKLKDKFDPTFLLGIGHDPLLEKLGIKKFKMMDWNDVTIINGVKFTFLTCQHWSARGISDRNHMLWGSFAFEDDFHKVYFAGDTGYGDFFKEINSQFNFFDLALIPVGAYEPRWFMKDQHMNPEEAVLAHIDLKSKLSIGMHFGTFQLTNEGIDTPGAELETAKQRYNVKNFLMPDFGEEFVISGKK